MELRSGRLWLIAGTGEGPDLARHFLAQGWRVRVSVVSADAGRAYPQQPDLEVAVGSLGGEDALRQQLNEAQQGGDPFQWLVDASHPFATRITAQVFAATRHRPERLVRLERPRLPAPLAIPLHDPTELPTHLQRGDRLLLAIGARHLRGVVAHASAACLHARVLPHPQALRSAQQAGIPSHHIACLRPTSDGALEEALCRHWQISTILCRQSGGLTEALWQRIAAQLNLRLLLLLRPPEPEALLRLPFERLLAHVGSPVLAHVGSPEVGGSWDGTNLAYGEE